MCPCPDEVYALVRIGFLTSCVVAEIDLKRAKNLMARLVTLKEACVCTEYDVAFCDVSFMNLWIVWIADLDVGSSYV